MCVLELKKTHTHRYSTSHYCYYYNRHQRRHEKPYITHTIIRSITLIETEQAFTKWKKSEEVHHASGSCCVCKPQCLHLWHLTDGLIQGDLHRCYQQINSETGSGVLQEESRAQARKITMLICTAGQTARHTGKEAVLTSAWVEAWSIAATDKDVLGSMSSNASSMFS